MKLTRRDVIKAQAAAAAGFRCRVIVAGTGHQPDRYQ